MNNLRNTCEVGRLKPPLPQNVHVLIPRTCEFVGLQGNGELSLQIELWLLAANFKMGRLFSIIWMGPVSSQESLQGEEGGRRESEKEIRRRKQSQGGAMPGGLGLLLLALKMEEEDASQGIQEASRS